MIALATEVDPPFGPWAALAFALALAVIGRFAVYLTVKAYRRGNQHHGVQPPWWRMRVTSVGSPLAPGSIMIFACAGGMALFSLYLFSEFDPFAMVGVVVTLGGMAYYAVMTVVALFSSTWS